jgi:ABC-type branched-subunit amino acid transport system ATPase component
VNVQATEVAEAGAVLEARGLFAGYHGVPVVRDLNLVLYPGEIVALLGPNGAGKTTALLALSGDLPVIAGEVSFVGKVSRDPLHRRARRGLSFVTEERSVFMRLTVEENLKVGGCRNNEVLELFPDLKRCLKQKAGSLSGGEQQMLTLARAIARRPKVLLADELSLGLAPLIVERLLEALRVAAASERVAVLMVEQHIVKALDVADRAYVMRRGVVEMSGRCTELRSRLVDIAAAYLSRGASAPTAAGDTEGVPPAMGHSAAPATANGTPHV